MPPGSMQRVCLQLEEGKVKMLVNDILDEQDLEEGYILACQSLPTTDTVKVTYSE